MYVTKRNIRILLVFAISLVLALAIVVPALAEESLPYLPLEPVKGVIQGTGTHFEVTDSDYINVTLDSSEPISLTLSSFPATINIRIKPISADLSTQISLGGLTSSTTFYKYEDDKNEPTTFTTDANGNYTYIQDLSAEHLVTIQTREGTKYLRDGSTGGDCTLIGNWNWTTRTCTLTQDVYEQIRILSNNITLDGDGHTINTLDYSIYCYGVSGVTVKNLNITSTMPYNGSGIALFYSAGNTITGVNVSNKYYGIHLGFNANENVIRGNTLSANNEGITLWSFNYHNTISDNTLSDGQAGIGITSSNNNNTISNNTISTNIISNYTSGVYLYQDNLANTISDNTITNNNRGILLGIRNSSNTLFHNNVSNAASGIFLSMGNSGNSISDNTISNTTYSGLRLDRSNSINTFHNNTVSDNTGYGILLLEENSDNFFDNQIISNAGMGILLARRNSNNTFDNNSLSMGNTGIAVLSQNNSSNIISRNTISSYTFGISQAGLDNLIYHNNFLNNIYHAREHSASTWNKDAPEGGNYWSNYDTPEEGCYDTNSDNFCDSPLYIPYYGYDYLPWAIPNGWLESEPPAVTSVLASPNPAPLNTDVIVSADVDDSSSGNSDIISADYSLDGGAWTAMTASDGDFNSPSEDVQVTLSGFSEAGVYEVCVRGTDASANTSSGDDCTLFAVYDQDAGFVTGGGWISSPEEAYKPDPSLAGKATFGFVSEYKKGAETPTGNTEFQFHAADLNFHSDSYEWLVVTGSSYARFKGVGTINGMGDYKFMVWAGDGDPDTFRIRLWQEDEATGHETDVYDNGLDQEIGGGSIMIHSEK